jgi:6-phosphogluconate dehydrogenase
VAALSAPRTICVMVPAGEPTESTIAALEPLLAAGDTIVDGGNTNFHDGVRRAEALRARQIHYVKMVHHGIENGWMQAYAEGFDLMHASPYKIDLAAVAALWNHGSIVRSWLLELGVRALAEGGDLSSLQPYVEDSGEGHWTVQEAIDRAIPLPVITASLLRGSDRVRTIPSPNGCLRHSAISSAAMR